MSKKHTISDIEKASVVDVKFEFGEEDLFERISDDEWHHEHWERKNVWDYEEDGLTDSDVLDYVNSFPKSVRIEKRKTLKGHSTRAPAKKCPVKVNFRGMI